MLDGKVTLITGGARGMGAAEAKMFCEAGASVVITDVLTDEGMATAKDIGDACTFLEHDVSSEDRWSEVMASIENQHGRLDVLVNNAGIAIGGPLLETSLDEWQKTLSINQTGVFLGMKSVVPLMSQSDGGSIINISSIAGLRGTRQLHAYGATKWAVRGMSKSAALELAPHRIRVNSVHPGLIDTAMLDEIPAPSRQALTESVPIGRLTSPEEVATLVRFLASDESSSCTGHEFVIDGGLFA